MSTAWPLSAEQKRGPWSCSVLRAREKNGWSNSNHLRNSTVGCSAPRKLTARRIRAQTTCLLHGGSARVHGLTTVTNDALAQDMLELIESLSIANRKGCLAVAFHRLASLHMKKGSNNDRDTLTYSKRCFNLLVPFRDY